MGDPLDNEPNIPLLNKKTGEKVNEETASNDSLHNDTVPNIPWLHKRRSSAQGNHISDRGSASLYQVSKSQTESISTFPSNTDLEQPLTESNVPIHQPSISTQHRREANISCSNPSTQESAKKVTSGRDFSKQGARPKEDFAHVLDLSVTELNSSSNGKFEFDGVGFVNSDSSLLQGIPNINGPTSSRDLISDASGTNVTDQSSSLVCITEVELGPLLQRFQDVLKESSALQKQNETFLHRIRHDDSASCEALQQRITETSCNFTRLEDRITDGDNEMELLEEKLTDALNKLNELCKSFETKSLQGNVMNGNRNKRHRHQTRATNEADRHGLTNEVDQQEMNRVENEHSEGNLQLKGQIQRSESHDQRTHNMDSNLHISSRDKGDRFTTESNTSTNINGERRDTSSPHQSGSGCVLEDRIEVDPLAEVDTTKHQTVFSSSQTIKSNGTDGVPRNNATSSDLSTDVLLETKERVLGENGLGVDHVNQQLRSKRKRGLSVKRSSPSLKLDQHVSGEETSSRPRSRRRKMKCSDLGFRYRKTSPRNDNRLKVIRNEVVLRGGPACYLMDSNIRLSIPSSPRKEASTTTSLGGATFESFGFRNTVDVSSAYDAFKMHADMSAMGLDHFSITEADAKASKRWVAKANEERQKGTRLAPYRGRGPDTVLLLDTSESMRGQPFYEMIRIAKLIIEGIQAVHKTIGVEENIAITVIGQETTVFKHLTMDYVDLISSLDTLPVGGPSPFSAGLVMGLAALLGNASGVTNVRSVPLSSKVILISDGHATRDTCTTEQTEEGSHITSHIRLLLLPVLKDYAERGNRVFCVPVGDAKTVYFEDICRMTKGRIYPSSDVQRLVKMTQAKVSAIEMYEALKGNSRQQMMDILTDRSMAPFSVQQDAEDIVDYVEYLKSRETSTSGIELTMYIEQDPNMPPIGTRVRRGPSWKWKNQDTEGPGTVIGHQDNGMIWIEWDNGFKNRYHYQPDCYDVRVVDEPRQILGDHLIATGYLVKRGTDWTFADQDGGEGKIGVVFRVKENGIVGVRWPCGNTGSYKYGAEGRFDIEICDPNTTPRPRIQTGRESSFRVQNSGSHFTNENLPRPTLRNDPPRETVNTNTDVPNKIESCLPSVEEMNKKNTSLTPKTSLRSGESDIVKSKGKLYVKQKSPVSPDSPTADYRVKWQYVDSGGQFRDYPGNVNGKIEATYIKRPGGTVIINMDGVGYRLLFTKMQQIEINTKTAVHIRRTVLT
ncbi:uncharacterized protein LOC132562033 [Ylistrum balloti]|uniref:uncharacterized protein LOC132562033 n=1 Tax=Ylistrum balloti TaxID=509963 RepID=UPI002905E75B|nr:uncharacterized protein LOC132562033 [Ylistrum balloti]